MSSAIKLPDAVHRRINRYEKHKETFLCWFIETFVETDADRSKFTPTTQMILAGSIDDFKHGFSVSTCDLIPMAVVIRDARPRRPRDIPLIASEMTSDMKIVNAWFACNLKKGADGWTAHEGHKYYVDQFERAIRHLRQGSDATCIANPAPPSRIQHSTYQTPTSEDIGTMSQHLALAGTTPKSSDDLSAVYETAPESNCSNLKRRISRSSTVSSTRMTVTRSGNSGNLEFQSSHHESGYATWRSEAGEESSSEEVLLSTTVTQTHAISDEDMGQGIQSQRSESLDPWGLLDIKRFCSLSSTQESREASSAEGTAAEGIAKDLNPQPRKNNYHYAIVESDCEESDTNILSLESPHARKYPHYVSREHFTSQSNATISLSRGRVNGHSQKLLSETQMTEDSFDIDAFEDHMFKLEAIEAWNDRCLPP